MAADGESTGKSKDRAGRGDEADIDELVEQVGRLDVNELETIPTVVPREGDGYPLSRSGSVGQGPGRIGEPDCALTEDDLRRINTRKGLIQLLENKAVDIEEVRKTLLYEEELRQLQVELVKLQRWVQSNGERVAILVEGRDAAGKGGTIRRFTEHLNPRAMRVVALPKPTDEERGQWYFQRYIRQLPNKGEIVFFDRSWYNRAVVEPVMGFCSKKEHQRFLQQVPADPRDVDGAAALVAGVGVHRDWRRRRGRGAVVRVAGLQDRPADVRQAAEPGHADSLGPPVAIARSVRL